MPSKPLSPPPLLQQAITLHQQGKLAEAEAIYRALLESDPQHFNARQLLGTVCAQQQRYPEAIELLQQAIALDDTVAAAHHNLGNALQSLERYAEALAAYERALQLKPDYPEALSARGNAHKALQQWVQALDCYDRALALQPQAAVHISRGNMLRNLGRDTEAVTAYDAALRLHADSAEAIYNRANALLALQRYDAALAGFDHALAVRPDYPEALNNRGNTLLALKRYEEALASYDRALELRPAYASACFNRGNAFHGLRRFEAALNCYELALQYDPTFADACNGRGVVMMALQRKDEALAAYERALELRPDYVEALHNLGDALMLAKRFPEAAAAYERALTLDAHNKYVLGAAYDCRHHGCDWSGHEEARAAILAGVRDGRPVCSPFVFLSLADEPSAQLACARIFGAERHAPAPTPLWQGERYGHDKIRIAYLSADYHTHATAFLMAELFELHDRQRFEWFAYSFGPEREGAMRSRLERAFDHFSEVSDRSDREIARMLREQEIDIAVDLKGFTLHCRPGIFAHRPAPVQVNYLGYPGTMGVPYMDYILADATLIPPEHEPFYTEKIVRLPDSYQVNDRQRLIAAQTPTRAELGLPAAGFVFCCFNNNYKITPEIFTIWMRLLQAVPGSVLWLLADNPEATANLRRAAEQRGVAAKRIVFAPRMELSQHLARHRCADLFLDTLPYNAHTTTSDALWAGLPVLTCLGTAFAGRVAASLLKAVALPELITTTLADYEARALRLATHADELQSLRLKLAENRLTTPLFDSDRFRRHMEAAYLEMHRQYQLGLTPQGFAVSALAEELPHPGDAGQRRMEAPSPAPLTADEAFSRGTALLRQGQFEPALALLDQAAALHPGHAATHSNRAAALLQLDRFEPALLASQRAVELDHNFADAWNNLGSALMKLRRPEQALIAYNKAVGLNPAVASMHNNRGKALDVLSRHGEAALAYATVRTLDPTYRGLHSSHLFALRKACLWPERSNPADAASRMEADLLEHARADHQVAPFVLLAVTDDLDLLLTAARRYGASRYPPAMTPLWQGRRCAHEKIRIAYLSANFHSHAIAFLMAGLFETHDRQRFEWWGISFGPGKSGDMRARLEHAFDHFIDVTGQSDAEVAQLLYDREIDIAVDLMGYTQDCRAGILGCRPAPVQVNYLGFPGSMGAPHIDYILADATVIPPEHDPFYSEKVVRLPDSYQVNDRQRQIAAHTPTRTELGLPDDGFVFCCFNNNYKITPLLFDIWMRLLQAVPGSVLWLLASNAESAGNLRKEAAQRGVAAERLVFAPKLPLPEHLARHRRADLFLDTLPYNAHTTASDALWAGLPVLTCLGKAFAGRVAASLLKAVGLPELITENLIEYEVRALRLATYPEELQALRQKLDANRLTTPLFDTDRFRRHIEAAYIMMYDRYEQGLPPESFVVLKPMRDES